ncbi:hypothetical protein AAGG74_17415 [Bacillus mexicanus]|uniref:hypothetical protein n=1 Tax=Bacillus mexicanus TaxID=2834415 RepID=UPI003D19B5FB
MKKILIGGMICGIFIVSGCQGNKNDFMAQTVEAQPKKTSIYNVDYDLNVTSEGSTINVEVTIDNKENKTIPLLTESNDLFDVKLKDRDGHLIDQTKIKKDGRKEILSKEKVSWSTSFKVNMNKEFNVEADLMLKSKPYNKYVLIDEIKDKPVYVWIKNSTDTDISFVPNEKAVYTYQTSDKKKQKEEFKFFNKNKVQSFSKEKGVTLYSQEDDGIYNFISPDPVGDIDGTDFISKENMSLLIPFPIEKGTTWSAGKKKYEITDTNVKVKTKLDDFKKCIEITEIDGKEKRYYYYQEKVGLVKIKKARKLMPSKTELELIEIEKPKS